MSGAIEVLDLFSAAAGGWSLGMHRAGYRTMAACENVAWRRAVYGQNNPGVKIYDDVCTLTASRIRADLGRLPDDVVGSPPCQDISSANAKGKGVEGERSGLFFEAVRIIGECRPRWFALENSANLRTRGADAVLAALEALDYTCWTFVVRAGDIGANHERPRAWIIGCDLAQIADADGDGRDARWCRRGLGSDVSASKDSLHSDRDSESAERCLLGRTNPERAGNATDAEKIGRATRAGSSRPVQRDEPQHLSGHPLQGRWREWFSRRRYRPASGVQQRPRWDETGDSSAGRQVGVRQADRGSADIGGSLWSLADLAHRVWLDDGLPARMAGTRVAVGGPRGTIAASLIVEAYGDAVIPQIPEAIGRAILRVETAMQAALR